MLYRAVLLYKIKKGSSEELPFILRNQKLLLSLIKLNAINLDVVLALLEGGCGGYGLAIFLIGDGDLVVLDLIGALELFASGKIGRAHV